MQIQIFLTVLQDVGTRRANHPLHGDHLYTTQANKLAENSSQLRPVTLVPPWMAEVGYLFQLKSKIWFYSPLLIPMPTVFQIRIGIRMDPHWFWSAGPGSPDPGGQKWPTKIEKKPMRILNTAYTEVSRGFLRLFRIKNQLCTEVWYPRFDAFSAIWLYTT
jgi:hypothetical protein